jgi:hypothetical protein
MKIAGLRGVRSSRPSRPSRAAQASAPLGAVRGVAQSWRDACRHPSHFCARRDHALGHAALNDDGRMARPLLAFVADLQRP